MYKMITEVDREMLIDYGMTHLCDLIPYDDPNYGQRLRAMAESYAENEIHPDPDLEALCKWHDDLLEQGLLGEDDRKGPRPLGAFTSLDDLPL